MRRHPLIPAVVMIALATVTSDVPGGRPRGLALAPGDPAPPIGGVTLDRQRVFVEYDKHRFTLVNFWATWCEPCRKEMPSLERLHTERSADGLAVIGLLMDSVAADQAQKFLADVGVTYLVLKPDSRTEGAWGGAGTMPVTFLVDKQGRIVRRYVGATPEQVEGLVADAEAVLEGRPLGAMVIPEVPAVVSDEERWRAQKEKENQKQDGDDP